MVRRDGFSLLNCSVISIKIINYLHCDGPLSRISAFKSQIYLILQKTVWFLLFSKLY